MTFSIRILSKFMFLTVLLISTIASAVTSNQGILLDRKAGQTSTIQILRAFEETITSKGGRTYCPTCETNLFLAGLGNAEAEAQTGSQKPEIEVSPVCFNEAVNVAKTRMLEDIRKADPLQKVTIQLTEVKAQTSYTPGGYSFTRGKWSTGYNVTATIHVGDSVLDGMTIVDTIQVVTENDNCNSILKVFRPEASDVGQMAPLHNLREFSDAKAATLLNVEKFIQVFKGERLK